MRENFRMNSVRRVCGGCLLGCLMQAAPVSPAAEDKPAEVLFADDFAADSRKDYQTEGEVGWRKGALLLGPRQRPSAACRWGSPRRCGPQWPGPPRRATGSLFWPWRERARIKPG
jgi:hypothetical protein